MRWGERQIDQVRIKRDGVSKKKRDRLDKEKESYIRLEKERQVSEGKERSDEDNDRKVILRMKGNRLDEETDEEIETGKREIRFTCSIFKVVEKRWH